MFTEVRFRNARHGVPLLVVGLALSACKSRSFSPTSEVAEGGGKKHLSLLPADPDAAQKARQELIRGAAVRQDRKVSVEELRAGPKDKHAFAFRSRVECTFHDPDVRTEESPAGLTPKFNCVTPEGEKLKVKYSPRAGIGGPMNMEVFGEALSTRLLWALGFGADKIYPVVVHCKGCPSDPWSYVKNKYGAITSQLEMMGFASKSRAQGDFAERIFELAAIEQKIGGVEIAVTPKQGWLWPELDMMSSDEALRKEQKRDRDALTILAAFIQHMDAKAEQQRLVCQKDHIKDNGDGTGTCNQALMLVQDPGSSWGRGFAPLQGAVRLNKIDVRGWGATKLWKDVKTCKVRIHGAPGSSLEDRTVGEDGRALLASLLNTLSDEHITALFEVGQVERIEQVDKGRKITVADWVEAFKAKRDEVNLKGFARTSCPTL